MAFLNLFRSTKTEVNQPASSGSTMEPMLVTPQLQPLDESQSVLNPNPGQPEPTGGITLPTPSPNDAPSTNPIGAPLNVADKPRL